MDLTTLIKGHITVLIGLLTRHDQRRAVSVGIFVLAEARSRVTVCLHSPDTDSLERICFSPKLGMMNRECSSCVLFTVAGITTTENCLTPVLDRDWMYSPTLSYLVSNSVADKRMAEMSLGPGHPHDLTHYPTRVFYKRCSQKDGYFRSSLSRNIPFPGTFPGRDPAGSRFS